MTFRENYNQLAKRFATQQEFANALGVTQPAVYKWLSGQACMSARNALKAERITHGEIKAEDLCPELSEPDIA